MKKISDKTKELILKTLIVISATFLLMLMPGCLFLPLFIKDENTILTICYTVMFSYFISGGLFMVLQLIFGIQKRPSVKADKIESDFATFDSLLEYLRNALSKRKYIEQKKEQIAKNGEVILFIKELKLQSLIECFTIIRATELSDEIIDEANDAITKILIENNGNKKIRDSVNMISMFCVDHITSSFKELVNSNMEQGIKNGRLVTGISFEEKKLYVSKQKDGFAIAKYKHLRKDFMDIMNLKKKKN